MRANRYPAAAVTHRTLLLLVVLLLALAPAGCGGDDGGTDAKATATPKATPTPSNTDLSKKPVVTVPDELPPDTLQKRDIVVGKGPVAKKGDTVSMQYVGLTWSTSVEFDASWDRGKPYTFKLGEGGVIKGWDEGIPGMRQGGRRELTIPAELAYGAQGRPPDIGPNECLRFIVDLVKLKKG
jgi:peptidylprolyl isomerase